MRWTDMRSGMVVRTRFGYYDGGTKEYGKIQLRIIKPMPHSSMVEPIAGKSGWYDQFGPFEFANGDIVGPATRPCPMEVG